MLRAKLVKPRMSAFKTVTSLRSPPSRKRPRWVSNRSATLGENCRSRFAFAADSCLSLLCNWWLATAMAAYCATTTSKSRSSSVKLASAFSAPPQITPSALSCQSRGAYIPTSIWFCTMLMLRSASMFFFQINAL